MGKLIYDEREGYSYESDRGILYDLLEGVSLKGSTTSDIVFITLNQSDKVDEEFLNYIWDDNIDFETYVGYFSGADLFKDAVLGVSYVSSENDMLEILNDFTSKYEEEYDYILKDYKKRCEKEYEIRFEKYGKCIIKARNEKEAMEKASLISNENEISWNNDFIPTVIIEEEE